MTTIHLYKDCKVDNIARMSSFADLTAQNTYYSGLDGDPSKSLILDGTFNKIGEPILLPKSYEDIIGFSYGRMKVKDLWLYFSISDYLVIEENKTQIVYKLDCWETGKHQLGVTLGKGFLRRSSSSVFAGAHKRFDVQPIAPTYSLSTLFSQDLTYPISILIYYRPTNSTESQIYELQLASHMTTYIIRSNWVKFLTPIPNFIESDIVGAWISPLSPEKLDPGAWTHVSSDPDEIPAWKLFTSPFIPIGWVTENITMNQALTTSDIQTDSITDMRGNIIWTCPYGKTFNNGITLLLDFSPTTCKWTGKINGSNYESNITIPCEPLAIFVDSYTEYFARQRDTDITTRKLSNQKALVSGIVSAGTNAGLGGLTSGTVGGAMGGLAVVSAIGNYVIGEYYAPKEQNIVDKTYEKTKDELALTGDSVASLLASWLGVKVLRETYDTYTQNRINGEINTIGYVVNIYSTNCQTYYTVCSMSGDFEIMGNIPELWKQQIRDRFNGGVTIVG